jgi:hypothetical protein
MSDQGKPGGDLVMEVRGDMGHLEAAFTGVSTTLDSLPRDKWPLFLAKLCLLLADRVGDPAAVANSIETARTQLDR